MGICLTGKRIAFYTLGCKLNFSETSTISRLAQNNGMKVVPFQKEADVYVINTCSVTRQAEKKCRNIIRRAIRSNKNSMVVLIGCYAQLKPEDLAELGVALVLGIDEKQHLLRHIVNYFETGEQQIVRNNTTCALDFYPAHSLKERTRSFLKVQDGCDYFCSYCTIPYARGRSRSSTVDEVLEIASDIIDSGISEIVLTGVNIGDFGKHTGETFIQLIRALDQLPGDYQYRISSIEPDLLSPEIVSFVSKSRHFTPHFHIPLQSGSDTILESMGRKYNVRMFEECVNFIRKLMPDAGIGVDVITGFPGEDDAMFLETLHFLQKTDISYGHIFPFSERPGTRAEKLEGKVSPGVIEERVNKLMEVEKTKKKEFYKNNFYKNAIVIFETFRDGKAFGYTGNYVHVQAEITQKITKGKRSKVKLTGEYDQEKKLIIAEIQ